MYKKNAVYDFIKKTHLVNFVLILGLVSLYSWTRKFFVYFEFLQNLY
jgi:hypothetical protein